jgi:beta-lactamase regulating signal transducer with metallopeptidase domain
MTATFEFMQHASGAALAAILNSGWLALVAAVAVGIMLRFTPRMNAATRHAAWWMVLAIVAIGPWIPATSRVASVPAVLPHAGASFVSGASTPALAVRAEGSPAAAPSHPQQSPALGPLADSPVSHRAFRVAAPRRGVLPLELRAGNWPEILLAAWFTVFVLLLTRVARGYMHLQALRKGAWPAPEEVNLRFERCLRHGQIGRKPRLLVASGTFSPLAAGFRHPVVILPERLIKEISGAELENVLLHELAHFARRDNWTNLLARLAACAVVLHPVAAWALSRIEREREAACDDWAVAISGSAREYAATLARLFEVCGTRRRELTAIGMAHRSSRLGERIESVLRAKRRFAARTSFACLALCTAAGLGVLAAGAQVPGWITLLQDSAAPAIVVSPSRPDSAAVSTASTIAALRTPLSEPAARAVGTTFATRDVRESDPQSGRMSPEDWTAEWTLESSHSSSSNPLQLSFGFHRDGTDWTERTGVPLSSLRDFSLNMLERDGPLQFEYVREAGELLCEGTVRGGRAHGTFTVKPNAEFVSALEKSGYSAPDERDVVFMVMSDVTVQFAREVKATGLELTPGDLAELRSHGVTADYIRQARQAGLNQFSAHDFCELRTHGVEPDYLQGIVAADPKLTADDIAELRTHGVEPDYLKGMQATGIALSMEDIASLRTHGVEPTYLEGIHEADSKLSVDDIDDYRTHGVEPGYLKEMRAVDGQLNADDVSELRTHGVEPQYLEQTREVAVHLSIDEICELRTHGVEAEYYKNLKAVDAKLSVDEITNLGTHGVEAEYYKEMKAADPKLSVDEITELRTHGVEPSHLKDLRGAAPNLSIEDLMELSSHGVPGSLVAEARHEGYHFTAGDFSELWSHGVDAKYLRDLQDMGVKNLTAEQILRLRRSS